MKHLRQLLESLKRGPEPDIPYDPSRQDAVLLSSICTGETAAGFRDRETGRFTEVMLIRSPEDERRFKEMYGLTDVRKEY